MVLSDSSTIGACSAGPVSVGCVPSSLSARAMVYCQCPLLAQQRDASNMYLALCRRSRVAAWVSDRARPTFVFAGIARTQVVFGTSAAPALTTHTISRPASEAASTRLSWKSVSASSPVEVHTHQSEQAHPPSSARPAPFHRQSRIVPSIAKHGVTDQKNTSASYCDTSSDSTRPQSPS